MVEEPRGHCGLEACHRYRSEFGLFGIPRRDVPWLFRDLAAIAPGCRYPDCLHLHEPSCAVQEAVEAGLIARFRYESYLRIMEGLGMSTF